VQREILGSFAELLVRDADGNVVYDYDSPPPFYSTVDQTWTAPAGFVATSVENLSAANLSSMGHTSVNGVYTANGAGLYNTNSESYWVDSLWQISGHYPVETRNPRRDYAIAVSTAFVDAMSTIANNAQENLRRSEEFTQQHARWQDSQYAYDRYLQDLGAYHTQHAAWEVRRDAHDDWIRQVGGIADLRASAQQYQLDRDSWVALVNSVANEPGVSWPGDPSVVRTTQTEIAAIAPRLPIWEAYLWFRDSAHHIPEAEDLP